LAAKLVVSATARQMKISSFLRPSAFGVGCLQFVIQADENDCPRLVSVTRYTVFVFIFFALRLLNRLVRL